MAIIPLLATLIALWFGWLLLKQFRAKHKAHHLWWSLAIVFYACAAFGEFFAMAFGWNPIMYKVYYFAAVSLVAVMAVGQMYLFSAGIGRIFAVYVVVTMAVFIVMLFVAPLNQDLLNQSGITVAGSALGKPIRPWFSILLSAIPGLIMIVGPLISWWKTRSWAPLSIAAGAIVLSTAGESAKFGHPELLVVSELIGIAIMFYGFLKTPSPTGEKTGMTVS